MEVEEGVVGDLDGDFGSGRFDNREVAELEGDFEFVSHGKRTRHGI